MSSQPLNYDKKNIKTQVCPDKETMFHSCTSKETTTYFQTSAKLGLSNSEAKRRLTEYGFNLLEKKKQQTLFSRFFSQFADFMVIILLVSAVISFVVSFLEGKADFIDPLIILAIVVLNAVLGVIQETKAERSLEALQKISSPHSLVLRDGTQENIPSSELVPGDILLLEAGACVSADARLLTCSSLKSEEASLTGESLPIEKNAEIVLKADALLGDRKNMVYAGSILTHGRGTAVVTATGMKTEVGHIASLIQADETPKTPLQKRLDKTGHLLGITAVTICILIFILGFLQGRPLFDMFMISVSLGVASIPEGLSIVVTIMLSLGVQRMAKKNAVIRSLPAVETLGSATYICSDKTGTLTQNKMTVTKTASLNGIESLESPYTKILLEAAMLCTDTGNDPTENAILIAGEALGLHKKQLTMTHPRVFELPFDSNRKMMTSVNKFPKHYRIITKGAPDFLLLHCNYITVPGSDHKIPLNSNHRKKLETIQNQLSSQALRVLAVAYKDSLLPPTKSEEGSIESDLTFLGFFGMIDPPRPEAAKAVAICKTAGIIPVMITGDHAITASAIAESIGLIPNTTEKKENILVHYTANRFHLKTKERKRSNLSPYVISGEELNCLTPEEFHECVKNYRVFARVSPEHKVRIVKALQKHGEIVAMTGDGINDAPALKAADIGCAMGKTGTDVAKNAADMILLDDNFATIVSSVREGRGIYGNIKKAVHFLLSCNFGEIVTILTAILLGMPSPLLAIQLLWVNLVTDALPALAFAVEPVPAGVMKEPPISQGKSLFSGGLGFRIILEGMMIGLLSLIAYQIGGRTMAFAVLSLSQLFHAFNIRSEHSLAKISLFSNPKMLLSFFVGLALQISVISIPTLATTFKVTALSLSQWATVFCLSFAPIIILELQKKIRRK